jgi:glutathione synthase/RimK-type ligase-like ATP-grasp enzyme
MSTHKKLPKLGFLYLDYVMRFFDYSNFKGWPDKIEEVTYHWKNDKDRFIKEIKRKKIEVLVGNIPATAYETFREIAKALPGLRFIPSIETQFANKSKENVTLFCQKHKIPTPNTRIFYDHEEGDRYLKKCFYPQIVKRSYGPSNYGGYFVHKVNNYKEAKELFAKKEYSPMYMQNAIPLKDSGDLRVMLIGHKPVCAFWRYSLKGEWITNTSQGGNMSYKDVPMAALEVAVQASKAAKAEYWACDIGIDKNTGNAYVIECATAFAAFPYIRDWIGQYIMWELSEGRFRMPYVPLFSWEELGKMDPTILRTLRHLYFANYTPSADGAMYISDPGVFDMQKAELSDPLDFPDPTVIIRNEADLPQEIKEASIAGEKSSALEEKSLSLASASLTDLLSLYGMDEDIAIKIKALVDEGKISTFEDLKAYSFITEQHLKTWRKSIS